jgi:hypothetical protein
MSTTDKQAVALGPSRDAALRVLMPRVIGAIRADGVVRQGKGKGIIEVQRGDFWILIEPDNYYIYLAVWHRRFRCVFSARLFSDGSGTSLDNRVYVIGWDRSVEHRSWQAELFETFKHDSDWLLSLPQRYVRPEIVTTVLSHIAAQTGG